MHTLAKSQSTTKKDCYTACNKSDRTYLAVSQWEVAGASQCRKGTLCSLMWISYKPYSKRNI